MNSIVAVSSLLANYEFLKLTAIISYDETYVKDWFSKTWDVLKA